MLDQSPELVQPHEPDDQRSIEPRFGVVAHELRTPLVVAHMAVRQLAPGDDATQRRVHAALQRNLEVALRLTEEILEAERLDVASGPSEALDLGALVSETLDDVVVGEPELASVEARVPEGAAVTGGALAVRRILTNLLHNAARHGRGPVVLLAQAVGACWELVVRDQGPGIAPDDREHVFEPYARGDRAASGLGLGLPIARGLARSLGGDLEARPGPDGGCDMALRLPRTGGGAAPAQPTMRSVS